MAEFLGENSAEDQIRILKAEREKWYAAKGMHKPELYKKALARINAEIRKHEQVVIG